MTILLATLGLTLTSATHPFHITLAEAEYNSRSRKLEVALRVYHPTDLEQALSRREGKPIELDSTPDIDQIILAYLQDRFEVTPPGRDKATITWVGKEVDLKTAWLYFEVDLPEGLVGTSFRDRLLLEVEPDQTNTITFRHEARRASLQFTRHQDRHVFDWPAPMPDPEPQTP